MEDWKSDLEEQKAEKIYDELQPGNLAEILEKERAHSHQSQSLCNGGIIMGNKTMLGVVFLGNEKQKPDMLLTKDDLDVHCKTCQKQTLCGNEQRAEILKIFQQEKKSTI